MKKTYDKRDDLVLRDIHNDAVKLVFSDKVYTGSLTTEITEDEKGWLRIKFKSNRN